jgi:5-methyltetrahydrofolate--homocysteine methyltransferase
MQPAASVSGYYLSHPKAQYFAIARIAEDQVQDYGKRKGMSQDDVRRWLAPLLG